MKRLWEKVDKSGDCWIWTGYCLPEGYGRLTVNNRQVLAHRLVFELEVSDIPVGMLVCHTCDNPSCVNPDHLFLGTSLDNTRDAQKKDRSGRKLNIKKAMEIKSALSAGAGISELAREYGVTPSAIHLIKNGTNWNHVKEN